MDYPKKIFVVKNNRNPFGMGEWNGEDVYEGGETYISVGALKKIFEQDELFKKFLESGFWDAHLVDLNWRHNGEYKVNQADWLKDIWYLIK